MSLSFESSKDAPRLWMELVAQRVVFIEDVNPELIENGISPTAVIVGNVHSYGGLGGDAEPPFGEMRVEVRARDESEITSLHGKYPLGWLEVGEEAVSAVVQARASLLNSIAMHLPLVSSGGFAISLTLPYLESYPIGFYPLLAYTYRANASASPE